MLDIQGPNGYSIRANRDTVNVVTVSGEVVGSYNPIHGECVLGIHTPKVIVKIMEDLEYGRKLMERSPHPVQCE